MRAASSTRDRELLGDDECDGRTCVRQAKHMEEWFRELPDMLAVLLELRIDSGHGQEEGFDLYVVNAAGEVTHYADESKVYASETKCAAATGGGNAPLSAMGKTFQGPHGEDTANHGEGKSKLLAADSDLYRCLHAVKGAIRSSGLSPRRERMGLHIEVTTTRVDDATLRDKAESLHGARIDVTDEECFGVLGGAFVLWTPEVPGYGRTHITIAFFGKPDVPDLVTLREIARQAVAAFLGPE
eukprot:jgi/Tetstr1/463634/TSEL_008496.t2